MHLHLDIGLGDRFCFLEADVRISEISNFCNAMNIDNEIHYLSLLSDNLGIRLVNNLLGTAEKRKPLPQEEHNGRLLQGHKISLTINIRILSINCRNWRL